MYLHEDNGRPELDAAATHAPCLHLLSKGMYVTGQVSPDRAEHGAGDGYCWCNQTQRSLGPDSGYVDRAECRPGRSCYQPRL